MSYKVVMPQYVADPAKNFLREKGYEVIDGFETTEIDELKKIVADADALLVRTAPYTKEVIDAAPKLKVISRMGVGYENIDVDYCSKKGIWVTYAPQGNFNTVAEHAIGLMIAAAHLIVCMDKAVRNGQFAIRNEKKGHDLAEKTLGVIGFGRIGSCVAQKAYYGLGMKIVAFDSFLPRDKFPEYVMVSDSIDMLLQISDVVSLHMPSTEETIHSVNKDFFMKMKRDSILINCARGNIVNEADLYDALKNDVIGCAAVDVMSPEPPDVHNPLFTLDNFIVTPHNAALTVETMERMGVHAAMGIDDVFSGRTPQWPIKTIQK